MPIWTRTVRVFHPAAQGDVVLRTAADWDADLAPTTVASIGGGRRFDFDLSGPRTYLSYKACLRRDGVLHWAEGTNRIVALAGVEPEDVYPAFFSGFGGRLTDVIERPSRALDRSLALRVYLPAGYDENTLKRYPVLYVHDGANLFLPEEAFGGQEWRLDETLQILNAMSIIDRTIVVGLHAGDRLLEYTSPAYDAYASALIDEVKPFVDGSFRTLPGPRQTGLMGSSLGGVVSFHLAWEHPDVFGTAACLSSTFGWRDDLAERVETDDLESRRGLRFYLDSGWPGDNYEATLAMATGLMERGFRPGSGFLHFSFPRAAHDERAWGARCHLPLQFFAGKLHRRAGGVAVPL